MKRVLCCVLTFVLLLAVLPAVRAAEAPLQAHRFEDVTDEAAYYYEPVSWALDHTPQIARGIDETRFGPEESCTRAQTVTFLWRCVGEPKAEQHSLRFEDVDGSDYFYPALLWAVEAGIVSGTDPEHFSPEDRCTRAQTVTILWRCAGKPAPENADAAFDDVAAEDYFFTAVLWAKEHGITKGANGSRFSPEDPCTRAQTVTLLQRGETLLTAGSCAHVYQKTASAAPTCRTAGWTEYVCTLCGNLRCDDYTEKLPHDDVREIVPATCTGSGWEQYTCKTCGRSYRQRFTEPLGHDYAQTVTAPQPGVRGYIDQVCRRCGTSNRIYTGYYDKIDELPDVSNPILSRQELRDAVHAYHIDESSPAFRALASINTVYAAKLTADQRSRPMLFIFEGCGSDLSPDQRFGAMAVVVRNGRIVFLDRNSSTIPDWPFDPNKNDDGQAMPTVRSGIYLATAVNQFSAYGYYAAWHVNDCRVVRFNSRNDYFASTSKYINVHRRTDDSIAPYGNSWVNSCGCILVGKAGRKAGDPYADWIASVGLVRSGSTASQTMQYDVSGTLIIDRSFGRAYLEAIGYPAGAIDLLG